MPSTKSTYDPPPSAPPRSVKEDQIEYGFIGKLQQLKYEYRPDIRDRASLERNFREKFEALNRVTLSDGEFTRLLDEIVTADVFTASRKLRERETFKGARFQDSARMSSKKAPMASQRAPAPAAGGDFDALVSAIVDIHEQTRAFSTKAVNVALTLRNWLIGYRIEVYERQGVDRATYGDKLMDTLAKRLVKQGWARCDRRELYRFRQLYLTYRQIVESLTPQSLLLPELGSPPAAPIRESVCHRRTLR